MIKCERRRHRRILGHRRILPSLFCRNRQRSSYHHPCQLWVRHWPVVGGLPPCNRPWPVCPIINLVHAVDFCISARGFNPVVQRLLPSASAASARRRARRKVGSYRIAVRYNLSSTFIAITARVIPNRGSCGSLSPYVRVCMCGLLFR